jgi:hypothetical protein
VRTRILWCDRIPSATIRWACDSVRSPVPNAAYGTCPYDKRHILSAPAGSHVICGTIRMRPRREARSAESEQDHDQNAPPRANRSHCGRCCISCRAGLCGGPAHRDMPRMKWTASRNRPNPYDNWRIQLLHARRVTEIWYRAHDRSGRISIC